MSHFKNSVLKTALSAVLIGICTTPMTANAAISPQQGPSVTYKTSLSAVEGLDSRVLDWRNPSLEFTFDASETDWTDGLELLLSADPLGKVSRRTPLMVQFNGDTPTPVITRGQGFDARIKLDAARMRPRNNVIKFTYNTPTGSSCLTPEHGGWRLDFKNSLVIIKARSKARDLDVRDVEAKLINPTTAPKSVRLVARGPNTSTLQALAAQGVGLRMNTVPEFKTGSGSSEFDIILGRRDQLYSLVSDKKVLNGTGARIFVLKGRKMRLVITGDTDADVMASAKAFATYQLPESYGSFTSPGELNMQNPLSTSAAYVDGQVKLDDLNGEYFDEGWGPKPKMIKFNVKDPTASTGELLLRISSNKNVSPNSRVSVNLNGKSLGFTSLDKSRKSVAFEIPAGSLHGTENILSITPELDIRNVSGCNFTQENPGFYLGGGSKLKIETAVPSPVAELSTMTATGAPFSLENAANTVVMMPATSSRDYNAALKVMAKLAKSSGHGWTDANYLRSINFAAIGADKNVLIIGPNSALDKTIRDSAPKALKSALKGQISNGIANIASIDRFAAGSEEETLRLYADNQAAAGRIRNGGVAALYPSPLSGNNVMGVITNVPGRSFASVADQLLKPQAWNALEGSVARWDNSKVIMAQTAMAVPGFKSSSSKPSKIGSFELPKITWPTFGNNDFEADDVETSSIGEKFDALKIKGAALLAGTKKDKVISPRLKPAAASIMTPVPKLRGMSKISRTPKALKLKAWANGKAVATKQAWQKMDLSGSLKSLQSRAKVSSDATTGSKAAAWGKEIMNTPALMLAIALAAFVLLLGLLIPSRGRGGRG